MPRQPQTINVPTGPIPTSSAAPFGVKAASIKNLMDFTFGLDKAMVPNATIRSFADLAKVAHFRDLFGEDLFKDPRSQPGCNLKGMGALYRHYREFLTNTGALVDYWTPNRNPLCLHQVRNDKLELIYRSNLPGESDTSPLVCGTIRAPVHMRPGRYMECLVKLPDNAPLDYTLWFAFWTYPGWQTYGTTHRYYAGRNRIECDGADNYGDNSRAPLGDTSISGFPNVPDLPARNIYVSNRDGYECIRLERDGNLVARFKSNARTNLTKGFHHLGMFMGPDGKTIDLLFDGEVIRRVEIEFGVKRKDCYAHAGSPPLDPARGEEFAEHHAYVSAQGGVIFNPDEYRDLETRPEDQPVKFAVEVKHFRIWEVDGWAMQPPAAGPEVPLPPVVTGTALGDLPAISSGSYAMDTSALSGAVSDRFGNAARTFGSASVVPGAVNGLPAIDYARKGVGGVSVRGPAVERMNGAHNAALFLVVKHRNPYDTGRQVLAQWSRDWPASAEGKGKITLYQDDGKLFLEAADDAGNVLALRGPWAERLNRAEIVVARKGVDAAGNVTLSLRWEGAAGAGSAAVLNAGAVPAANLTGLQEIALLTGRDVLGMPVDGLNAQLLRAVLVSAQDGSALSDADEKAIVARLRAQWGI